MTGSATPSLPSPGTLLRLGRVSNLPTVWTNVLAGNALAGGDPLSAATATAVAAMSLLYVGGMYLNDAFDHGIDAHERPTRPIPAGAMAAGSVFAAGFGMLVVGVAALATRGVAPGLWGLALAGAIVAYDAYHKGNPWGPSMMGLCRALVYLGSASATVGTSGTVLIGACALGAHVVGLTYAARQESLDRVGSMWPLALLALPLALGLPSVAPHPATIVPWLCLACADAAAVLGLRRRAAPGAVPGAVAALIAAVSLLDGMFAAAAGDLRVAAACLVGWGLTRVLQRWIPGT
ncbi:MAG: UbiA family prenyltransferase [Methylobacterium radiotolerans]